MNYNLEHFESIQSITTKMGELKKRKNFEHQISNTFPQYFKKYISIHFSHAHPVAIAHPLKAQPGILGRSVFLLQTGQLPG
jgi:hypothetical protein